MTRAATVTHAALTDVAPRGAVLSIGNFDGVHLGHRLLLGRMREVARERGVPSVVVTFFPPARVLFGGGQYLMTPAEKLIALQEYEPDVVVSIPFDRDFAETDKDAWLEELAALEPSLIVVGQDFRFGKGRAGGLGDLRRVAAALEAFPLLEVGGAVVSSSRVRELLGAGDVSGAGRLLGTPYLVRGVVTRGQRRGRQLGFPTANLAVPAGKALPLGVFAVRVEADGRELPGMANVGPRPSFPEAPPALEAHVFDFAGDLYARELNVRFVAHLRDQRSFGGADELRAQLRRDERAARAALGL